jgi:hypothetical protein
LNLHSSHVHTVAAWSIVMSRSVMCLRSLHHQTVRTSSTRRHPLPGA